MHSFTYVTETGSLTEQYVHSNLQGKLHFYMDVSRFDRAFGADNLIESRRFRDVVESKGHDVTYSEYDGGHNHVCWRGSFADAVLSLVGNR